MKMGPKPKVESMTKLLEINSSECFGCGTCADLCASVFGIDAHEPKARIIDQDASTETEIEEAIQACPAQCISWRNLDCEKCESCLAMCSNFFAFHENEQLAEMVIPAGSMEDCLEHALAYCSEECLDWTEE